MIKIEIQLKRLPTQKGLQEDNNLLKKHKKQIINKSKNIDISQYDLKQMHYDMGPEFKKRLLRAKSIFHIAEEYNINIIKEEDLIDIIIEVDEELHDIFDESLKIPKKGKTSYKSLKDYKKIQLDSTFHHLTNPSQLVYRKCHGKVRELISLYDYSGKKKFYRGWYTSIGDFFIPKQTQRTLLECSTNKKLKEKLEITKKENEKLKKEIDNLKKEKPKTEIRQRNNKYNKGDSKWREEVKKLLGDRDLWLNWVEGTASAHILDKTIYDEYRLNPKNGLRMQKFMHDEWDRGYIRLIPIGNYEIKVVMSEEKKDIMNEINESEERRKHWEKITMRIIRINDEETYRFLEKRDLEIIENNKYTFLE